MGKLQNTKYKIQIKRCYLTRLEAITKKAFVS